MNIADSDLKNSLFAASKLIQAQNEGQLLSMSSAEKIFIQIQMHKIPNLGGSQELRRTAVLPNRLFPEDISTCFIIKNTDEKKDDENCIEKTKELLKEQGITGDMFITLDQLKKEYKGHELKRKLAQQFDVFFSDSRIARLALPHLGKEFFSRRRVPFVIKLDRLKKVRQEIDLVLRTVQFIVSGKGNNVTVHFGNTQMSEQELIDNFKCLVEKLGDLIPRGVKNVKSVNIQGTNTKAVPVYRSSEVDPAINEPCGLELERQTMYKQVQEMISDVQIKQKKRAKKTKKDKKREQKKLAAEGKENEQPAAEGEEEKKVEAAKEEPKKKRKAGETEEGTDEKKAAKPETGKRRAVTRSQKAKRVKISAE